LVRRWFIEFAPPRQLNRYAASLTNRRHLMSPMIYREPQPISRAEAEHIFASGDADAIASALVDITFHDRDWRWVQNKCIGFARVDNSVVRQAAVTCLGHVARIHRKLDLETVLPVVDELSGGPALTTQDALDDIRMFVRNGAL
jgi:hypothetical protein